LLEDFATRLENEESLALDQLLNAVFLVAGANPPAEEQRDWLVKHLQRELSGA
jgi:hypothetical protein